MTEEKVYGFTDSKSKKEVLTKETIVQMVEEVSTEIGENYIKFANGILVQWGKTTHAKGTIVTSDVNLPMAYKDREYSVVVTPQRNGSLVEKYWIGDKGGNNTNKTERHFNVTSYSNNAENYDKDLNWVTIGRWK